MQSPYPDFGKHERSFLAKLYHFNALIYHLTSRFCCSDALQVVLD